MSLKALIEEYRIAQPTGIDLPLVSVAIHLMRLLQELEAAGRGMQSYRPDVPFTDMEKALGLMAYATWLKVERQHYAHLSPDQWSFPNDSARRMALLLVSDYLADDESCKLIRTMVPSFNPSLEVKWANWCFGAVL